MKELSIKDMICSPLWPCITLQLRLRLEEPLLITLEKLACCRLYLSVDLPKTYSEEGNVAKKMTCTGRHISYPNIEDQYGPYSNLKFYCN